MLGQGGFAITYLARDELERNLAVAVKEFFPEEIVKRGVGDRIALRGSDFADDFGYIRRQFLLEGERICGFDHPNLVRGISLFEQNETAYVVMRYESGSSLRHHLRVRGTFQVTRSTVAGLLKGMLDGLEYVHRRNWLHCDIKPANVFLGRDFAPVILDFGAARDKIRQRLFEHSELIVPYTPHYSPIEQDPEARLDLGPWTDIYQVGALIYRCVSGGKIPASSERIRGDAYFPLIEFFGSSPDYPRAFLEAIDWSLSLLPEDRPRSISAWKARLSQPMEEMLRREAEPQTRITKLESPQADDDPTPTRRSKRSGDRASGSRKIRPTRKSRRSIPVWQVLLFFLLLAVVVVLGYVTLLKGAW
ncbi:MAG: serine/threonine protein kinase [Akkermansiaceae bacterium]|nr:serine/threonine protein kinase [Akkermansiaceae bacterium]MCP5551132.1 serine/threonine protein kinase [Akkermansiaceae bacterium]